MINSRLIPKLLTLVALCYALPVQPALAAANFTLRDLTRLRFVTAAEISPDGQQIAYLLRVPRKPIDDDNGPPFSELHLADLQGHSSGFVTGKVDVDQIDWRNDQTISFLSKREKDKTKSLYVISVKGGEASRLLEFESDIVSYSWSPDGHQVAFVASDAEPEPQKKLKEKGFNQEIYEESDRYPAVWIADFKPDSPASKPRKLPVPGSASFVKWSPTGHSLAIITAATPYADDAIIGRRVALFDLKSDRITAHLDHHAKLGSVAWSPNGQFLVTISGADINDPREGRLLLWAADGQKIRSLIPGYKGHVTSAAWSDHQTVVYIGSENLKTRIAQVRTDHSTPQTQLSDRVASHLSVAPTTQSISFLLESPSHPPELHVLTKDLPSPKRLTSSNPWLEEISLAKQEAIPFKARDGLQLEGILIRPLHDDPKKRFPLILVAHGGPESHYSDGWLTSYASPGQAAAARGFAVFYPNYRGSTGRGVEFSKLSQGDPAGKEFDDLIDAVDHLIQLGLVDKGRVGITGGSYGGYASAWGATHFSDRFAASVMFVGISDWISGFGTTDIPNEMFHVHFNKWVWEHSDFFFQRSPLAHVRNHRTPLLILHGKDDPRVHPSQSLALYRYLKTLGQAPVRLVLYPGEGHGNKKAAAQFDYSVRLLQWMEHYLQGPGGSPPPSKLDYDKELQKHKP